MKKAHERLNTALRHRFNDVDNDKRLWLEGFLIVEFVAVPTDREVTCHGDLAMVGEVKDWRRRFYHIGMHHRSPIRTTYVKVIQCLPGTGPHPQLGGTMFEVDCSAPAPSQFLTQFPPCREFLPAQARRRLRGRGTYRRYPPSTGG